MAHRILHLAPIAASLLLLACVVPVPNAADTSPQPDAGVEELGRDSSPDAAPAQGDAAQNNADAGLASPLDRCCKPKDVNRACGNEICGFAGDGCGGVINCADRTPGSPTDSGACPDDARPWPCNWHGYGGTGCGTQARCIPDTACPADVNCGAYQDGCGGLLDCGSCTLPETCGSSAPVHGACVNPGTPGRCG